MGRFVFPTQEGANMSFSFSVQKILNSPLSTMKIASTFYFGLFAIIGSVARACHIGSFHLALGDCNEADEAMVRVPYNSYHGTWFFPDICHESRFSIWYRSDDSNIDSVKLLINDGSANCESSEPFTLYDNDDEDFTCKKLSIGTYKLTVKAYGGDDCNGLCDTNDVYFDVVDCELDMFT